MRKIISLLAAAAALTLAAPASAAVTLQTSGGILTGATGVNIGGTLYDVTFLEGSCSSLYGACATANFPFQTSTAAIAAAQALLDQVFIGTYDDVANATFGCSDPTVCVAYIPYAASSGNLSMGYAINRSILSGSDSTGAITGAYGDYSTIPDTLANYAKFTLSSATTAVPEPATWAMMLLGFGGIGFAMRRKHKTPLNQIA